MFDIGFTELLLVGVVALIVVGPERLPGLVRTTLSYIRQFKAGFANIRDEVERELALDDLKKDLDDSKNQVSQAVGYDDLHESLDDLRHIKDWHDDETVSDADIEADLTELAEKTGPHLPPGDAEADTGIEPEMGVQAKDSEVVQTPPTPQAASPAGSASAATQVTPADKVLDKP